MPDFETSSSPPGLSRAAVLTFAAAGGLNVANVYAAQPLLDAMGHDLGIAPSTLGVIVTLTQVGYALGLAFIVPLGDLVDRRRLIVGQALLSAIALLAVGTGSTAAVVLPAMVAVGLLAVVIQVLVAFAADLAAPGTEGRTIGTVTSGIVLGILGARFVSGLLADLGGWRLVYLISAALTLVMAAALWRVLPGHIRGQEPRPTYPALLRSTLALFVEEPLLRARAALAMLVFGAFSVLWTAMVLPLTATPWFLSHAQVGLFGLAGAAGAVAASRAGRLADRGLGQWTTGIALVLMLTAWWPVSMLPRSLWMLALGVIVLDLGVQAVHVTSQSLIFARRPQARSRLVAGYMVFYSIGSAAGALGSTQAYARWGWTGVCILGAAVSLSALTVWAGGALRPRNRIV
jgi:predicted MFS family arabinose efflux permease